LQQGGRSPTTIGNDPQGPLWALNQTGHHPKAAPLTDTPDGSGVRPT